MILFYFFSIENSTFLESISVGRGIFHGNAVIKRSSSKLEGVERKMDGFQAKLYPKEETPFKKLSFLINGVLFFFCSLYGKLEVKHS